jgi:hypothetical protein
MPGNAEGCIGQTIDMILTDGINHHRALSSLHDRIKELEGRAKKLEAENKRLNDLLDAKTVELPLTLVTGWTAWDTTGNWPIPCYSINGDRVTLGGMARGPIGTDTNPQNVIAILPRHLRPRRAYMLIAQTPDGPARIDVSSSGQVALVSSVNRKFVSLDSISFLI